MKKEKFKFVEKVWGEEIILVNNADYCGKLLLVDRNAESSYHYHEKKGETFYAIEGYGTLVVNGKEHVLAPFTRPKTIEPGDKHRFIGITPLIILEVSTFHDDADVVRLSKSMAGISDGEMVNGVE